MNYGMLCATVLLVSTSAGCGQGPLSVERDPDAPVQTVGTRYQVHESGGATTVKIPYTYSNLNEDTVYIVNCGGIVLPTLQKRQGTSWVQAWSGVTPLCLSAPITIPPGATFVDTLHVRGWPRGGNAYPQFEAAEVEGIYRLLMNSVVLHYGEDRQHFGDTLTIAQRVSNDFVLFE